MDNPLYLTRHGHRTWLKWHRARRRATDPVFTGARILEAMNLGASVEVDLVIHADHGCAVLHNFALDKETTGSGAVRDTDAATLRGLHLRDNKGQPLPDRVMLLEDLCALFDSQPPHPEALLQLDFKEDLAALDPQTVANFGASIGDHGARIILSGGDAEAVNLLAASANGLRTGYDPCYGESLERLQATGDHARFVADALAAAPGAEMIYLHHDLVLDADRKGFDLIGAFQAGGKRVDAWTINAVTPASIAKVERLLELKVDQVTTDDPEGLLVAFSA